MKKILVTGGTVFVSRYIAEYYVKKGYDVYVLNRNSRTQSDGVSLIDADRHAIGDKLRGHKFDIVIDTAYTATDVNLLLDALDSFNNYVLISSSAVYPEYAPQPFKESTLLAANRYWGEYGTNKIEAEYALAQKVPNAYILRPPYLYGQMNNIYREAFVFDCALANRVFHLPKTGNMKLQFLHIEDLCCFIDEIIRGNPSQRIFNVGNKETVSVREWVELCYRVVSKKAIFKNVFDNFEQRNYFCFYDYEFYLDVHAQYELLSSTKSLEQGLKEAFEWYIHNQDQINKRPYIDFIDKNF
ncbi:MAG: NAD-dependent epimerase/dehydratase family protein [Clostridia bacterium]|nr:NAD-dependent epimerase/dehydratase family protein [Clostridia bacterium]